ncbi:hypothetical protein V6Z11_D06G211900 [Gossypium hirsutum]
MKVSKLTAMDVRNCFQLHASLVFIVIITFTSNVQTRWRRKLIENVMGACYLSQLSSIIVQNVHFFFIKPNLNSQESNNIGFIKTMPYSISKTSRCVTSAISIVVVSQIF